MASELIEYFKDNINDKYIMEVVIWKLSDKRYENGIKYSLIFIDPKTQKMILMDNHHPKMPHIHIDKVELPYVFISTKVLLADFKNNIYKHFGVKI